MKKIRNLSENHKEIISYIFWGVMTTIVSWCSYSLFVIILPEGKYEVTTANVLSWISAVLFAFVTNKVWVFRSKSWKASLVFKELLKFVISRIASGAFEIATVPLLVKIGLNRRLFGIDGLLAKILVSIIVVFINYVLSKLLVFKRQK